MAARRGTTNQNHRGNTKDRRSRRRWLVKTFRADVDLSPADSSYMEIAGVVVGDGVPACRCYRCGILLTEDKVTVDRVVPGCQGGRYVRGNIRPACAGCNSETGATVRRKR